MGKIPRDEILPILQLALRHPAVLQLLTAAVYRWPVLLADLLLVEDGAILATYLVATWPRRTTSADDGVSAVLPQDDAFRACIKALTGLRDGNLLNLGEFARLLIQLQQLVLDANAQDAASLERCSSYAFELLRPLIQEQQSEVMDGILAYARQGVGTAGFSALLEALNMVSDADVYRYADAVVDAYRSAIQPTNAGQALRFVGAATARRFADTLLKAGPEGEALLKRPFNVRSHVAMAAEKDKFSARNEAAGSLRNHIRLLCRAISTFAQGSANPVLVDALCAVINAGSLSHDEKGKVPAFSGFSEAIPMLRGVRPKPIAQEIAQALTPLNREEQTTVVNALVQMDEPKVLAELLLVVPDHLKPVVETRISQLSPEEAAPQGTIIELQSTVHALMDAGLFEAAESYLKILRGIDYTRRPVEFENQLLRAELRFMRHQEQFDEILVKGIEPSPQSRSDQRRILHDTLLFYKGLVYLEAPGHVDAQKAVAAFRELAQRSPNEPAYAVNLLVARINRLLPDGLGSLDQGQKDLSAAKLALSEARIALGPQQLVPLHQSIYTVATAALELYICRPQDALRTLQSIDEGQRTPDAIALEAVVLSALGYGIQGLQLLHFAGARFGHNDRQLKAATEILKSGDGHVTLPLGVSNLDPVQHLKAALASLVQEMPDVQARVLSGADSAWPIEKLVTGVLCSSLAALCNLVVACGLDDVHRYDENDLNTLLRELLKAHFAQGAKWAVGDQSLGGATKKRNMGERDLVIGKDNIELAVIEAMKYSTSGNSGINSHAEKITFYSTCDHFFHLIYSHEKTIEGIVEHLEKVAERQIAGLSQYGELEKAPEVGNQPLIRRVRYLRDDGRKVSITFLVARLTVRIPT